MRRLIIALALFLNPLVLRADVDPYDVMAALLKTDLHPRVLNTLDLVNWVKQDPEPIFNPQEDFDRDGSTDIAISGIYDLAQTGKRYFLLVAGLPKTGQNPRRLFFEEYDHPVFIHQPGTTGEADLGEQTFSISFCWDCDKGTDFFWNEKTKRFDQRAWSMRKKIEKKTVEVAAEQVPEADVDLSLKMVGILPDIKKFVAAVQQRKGHLGTRVEWAGKPIDRKTVVYVFEKKGGKEQIFDRIEIDLERKRILKRALKGPKISL